MFTHLRESFQGFFTKLILFFLVAMFVLWGVGDVFRSMGGGPNNVATVGKVTISMQQLHNAAQRRPGQAQEVLAGLINDALVEQDEQALGIVVSDDTVVDFIGSLPEFRDKDGKFDKEVYEKVLRQSGTSEAHFIENIRHEIGAKLLIGVLTGWVQVPENLVNALYRTQEEQRAANLYYFTASAGDQKMVPPTEEEIKAYYDKHSKQYLAPEYRTLTYVALPIADLQSKVDVSPDDIKRTYSERKDDFRQPDRREVDDLQFDNDQDAKATAAAIAKDGFAKAAASAPISNKGKTARGAVAIQDLPVDAGPKVFALPSEGISSPMLVDFAWHIYHVGKLVPGRADTFDEAKPVITSELASRSAQETAVKLMNGFEDALAGGQTLDVAAQKIGQKAHTIGPITPKGLTEKGEKAELPPYTNFLGVAFNVGEGEHSQAVQAADGSYFLVRADKVNPAHVKPLAEVKAQVAEAALADKTQAELEKAAEKFSEQIRAGKKPAEALVASGLSAQATPSGNIKRGSDAVPQGTLKDKPLTRAILSEIFRVAPQETTHAYPVEGGGYMVATVTQVIPAPATPDPKLVSAIRDDLKETLADEILHQYLNGLRGKYPITINAAANAAALGLKNGGGAMPRGDDAGDE